MGTIFPRKIFARKQSVTICYMSQPSSVCNTHDNDSDVIFNELDKSKGSLLYRLLKDLITTLYVDMYGRGTRKRKISDVLEIKFSYVSYTLNYYTDL